MMQMKRFSSGHHGRQRRRRSNWNQIPSNSVPRTTEQPKQKTDPPNQVSSPAEPSMANEGTVEAVKIPHVEVQNCVGCGICLRVCPTDAISLIDRIAQIDPKKCVGCLTCMSICPRDAIHL